MPSLSRSSKIQDKTEAKAAPKGEGLTGSLPKARLAVALPPPAPTVLGSGLALNWTKEGFANALRKTYKDESFWEILAKVPPQGCGPFDGGCLIVAKAMIQAAGDGELVRIVNESGRTEHYGAIIGGTVFDFDGPCSTPAQWVKRFTKNEHIPEFLEYSAMDDLSRRGSITDDPILVGMVARLILNAIPRHQQT